MEEYEEKIKYSDVATEMHISMPFVFGNYIKKNVSAFAIRLFECADHVLFSLLKC